MAEATQLDFYTGILSRAMREIEIVQRGTRRYVEETRELVIEGTAKEAARIIGLPVREIYRLIEDGELSARSPKAEIYGDRTDALGRRIGFGIVVDLKDAFRIRFGKQKANQIFREFGLN